jgi:hypothetical protein
MSMSCLILILSLLGQTSLIETNIVERESLKQENKVKALLPGLIQYDRGQKLKGEVLMWTASVSLVMGLTTWYRSDREYDTYLSLPKGASRKEFDRHYNASNSYGTISIVSFVAFGSTFLYSLVDVIWLGGTTERYGLYLAPGMEDIGLCAVRRF